MVQSPAIESATVQSTRIQAPSRPESKRPGHVSRVQLLRYAIL